MNPLDIVTNLKKLFGTATSPGQAFDAIVAMRNAGVTWDDAYKAVVSHGKAERVRQRLDESDESEAWECPGCHGSRTTRDYCINPRCPEFKPNPQTAKIDAEYRSHHKEATTGSQSDPKFKNPKLGFGPYAGKALLEVIEINPGYVKQLSETGAAVFWREQARLAIIAAAALAPASRDTDATGYFNR
jgi:hypothetical protein